MCLGKRYQITLTVLRNGRLQMYKGNKDLFGKIAAFIDDVEHRSKIRKSKLCLTIK